MEKMAIKVERETFEMDGKTYFGYFIKGNIRGRDVKIGSISSRGISAAGM